MRISLLPAMVQRLSLDSIEATIQCSTAYKCRYTYTAKKHLLFWQLQLLPYCNCWLEIVPCGSQLWQYKTHGVQEMLKLLQGLGSLLDKRYTQQRTLYHSAWAFERHHYSGQIPCRLSGAYPCTLEYVSVAGQLWFFSKLSKLIIQKIFFQCTM